MTSHLDKLAPGGFTASGHAVVSIEDRDGGGGPGCVVWDSAIVLAGALRSASDVPAVVLAPTTTLGVVGPVQSTHSCNKCGSHQATSNLGPDGANEPVIVDPRDLKYEAEFVDGFWIGKSVLELGAGCGLAGITAAFLGANVTLTDTAEVIKHTALNVDANRDAVERVGGSVSVAELDWSQPLVLGCGLSSATWDIILASDFAVSLSTTPVRDFVSTLASLFGPAPSSTTAYLTHKSRSDEVDALLFQSFDEFGFDGEELPVEAQHPMHRTPRIDLLMVRRPLPEDVVPAVMYDRRDNKDTTETAVGPSAGEGADSVTVVGHAVNAVNGSPQAGT